MTTSLLVLHASLFFLVFWLLKCEFYWYNTNSRFVVLVGTLAIFTKDNFVAMCHYYKNTQANYGGQVECPHCSNLSSLVNYKHGIMCEQLHPAKKADHCSTLGQPFSFCGESFNISQFALICRRGQNFVNLLAPVPYTCITTCPIKCQSITVAVTICEVSYRHLTIPEHVS